MAAKQSSWIEETADQVVESMAARGKPGDAVVVCASGISPSGPIHLGNLREVMVAHAVAEELRHRGRTVRHLHFWDDYDRFRRVPAGVPASFEEYVGRPLSDVPDPEGDCHGSYAEHFMGPFDEALRRLGVPVEQIRQSVAYREGTYEKDVRTAIAARDVIAEVLARHRTRQAAEPTDEAEAEDGAEADGGGAPAAEELPVRIYCEHCGRDATEATLEPSSGNIGYRCSACGGTGDLADGVLPGKLVWKVDWPMRWAHYDVDFEPGGADHTTPGSSFDVGRELVRRVFGGLPPQYVGYSFVGIEGRSKISGSHGAVPTPAIALEVVEPSILRWQYLRRRPRNGFTISFGHEILRLYDEWDALTKRASEGTAKAADQTFWRMSVRTSAGDVATTPVRLPFRILAAAADVTQGNDEQMLRVVRAHTDAAAGDVEPALLEPRLSCARTWALAFQPDDERTRVRTAPAGPDEVAVDPANRRGIALLLDGLAADLDVDATTKLVYGIPKVLAGLPADAPPDDAIKAGQRSFFACLYELLTGADTGPRLPTLLLSLGRERVGELLAPWAE